MAGNSIDIIRAWYAMEVRYVSLTFASLLDAQLIEILLRIDTQLQQCICRLISVESRSCSWRPVDPWTL
jgi:hypothetical protein